MSLVLTPKALLEDVRNILKTIQPILAELVTLQKPTTAAAVVAFVLALIPGVNISTTVLIGIVVGVGIVASVIEKLSEITGANTPSNNPPTKL